AQRRVLTPPTKPRGQVRVPGPGVAERLAAHRQRLGGAGPGLETGPDPGRDLVAGPLQDRIGAEGIAGQVGVERVADPLVAIAAADLELVFDPRARRDLDVEVPDVGAGDPRERLRGLEPED